MDALVGQVLAGRYEIQRRIGAGGMGVVYEALQLDLGRRVAVKVLTRGTDPRDLARFRTEVLAVAAASHANVVQLVECRDDNDPPFFVMEHLHGEMLATALRREGTMPVERAVRIVAQVLSALSAAHVAGVVHRDVKPANVYLVATPGVGDVVKVLDFGIAKILDGVSRTTTGGVLGTPAYMAPEQILGAPIGPAADLYAVGLCLFEMLTGRRPWEDARNMSARVSQDPAPLVSTFRPDVPPGVVQVIARALEREPARRFSSAAVMLDALLAHPSGAGFVATPATAASAKSSSGLIFVVAMLSVLLVAASAAALVLGRTLLSGDSGAAGGASASAVASSTAPPVTGAPPPAAAAVSASASASAAPRPRAPQDAGTHVPHDAGTPAPAALGKISTATMVFGDSTTGEHFSISERETMQRSGPAVVKCASEAGTIGPRDQIQVTIVPDGSGRPQAFIIGGVVARGFGEHAGTFTACVERVAVGWNLRSGLLGLNRVYVFFNLA